jgi:hypothetical protein
MKGMALVRKKRAVIKRIVIILDFASLVFSSGVDRICLHLLPKENGPPNCKKRRRAAKRLRLLAILNYGAGRMKITPQKSDRDRIKKRGSLI